MIELVWDSERRGTGTAPSGASLRVGDFAEWSPTDLLALAVASCLMRTFLGLAAEEHLPVLGYVSTAVSEPADGGPSIVLLPCIVVPTTVATPGVLALLDRAIARSPVALTVAHRLIVRPDVHQVDAADGEESA